MASTMSDKQPQIVLVSIDKLIPADYNPRRISEHDFNQLQKSLKEFGAPVPATVNSFKGRENVIIGGHQRIEAAKTLGWKTFPCVYVSLPPAKERELNIRLNRNNGEWDFYKLGAFDMKELSGFGFTNAELGISDNTDPGIGDEDGETGNDNSGETGEDAGASPNEESSQVIKIKCPHCRKSFKYGG